MEGPDSNPGCSGGYALLKSSNERNSRLAIPKCKADQMICVECGNCRLEDSQSSMTTPILHTARKQFWESNEINKFEVDMGLTSTIALSLDKHAYEPYSQDWPS